MLGPHPRDKKPVELHAGRYGPYVKHGDVNATLPDRDKADSVTLDEAIALLAEKEGKQGATASENRRRAKAPAKTRAELRVPIACGSLRPRARPPPREGARQPTHASGA